MAAETTNGSRLLTVLDAEHPEWRPLLAVIKEGLREAERTQWARFVPALEHSGRGGRPLLDGAVINVAPRLVERWVRHILGVATAAGTEVEPLARRVAEGWLDPLLLFESAVCQDIGPAAGTGVVDRHADASELPAGLGRAGPDRLGLRLLPDLWRLAGARREARTRRRPAPSMRMLWR